VAPRHRPRSRTLRWISAALAALFAVPIAADGPAPRVHALIGARVVVAPGRRLESATVVLRDGVIQACGTRVAVPADARVWDLTGKTIYPGLLDPYAVVPPPPGLAGAGPAAETELPGEHPLIRSDRGCRDLPGLPQLAERLRRAGFTTAVFAPGDGLFRGTSCIANTGEGELAANLLRPAFAQHVRLEPWKVEDRYPDSLMGAMALFRQTILDALWHRQAQDAYRRNPAQARPLWSPRLAALEGVARGEELVVFETGDIGDSLRALALMRELRLHAFLVGNGHEYQRLAELSAQPVAQILPVVFPKAPAAAPKDDLTLSLAELRHWAAAPDNPRQVLDTGLTTAFTAQGLAEPDQVFGALAKSIARGLTVERALAGLTTAPAELMGLAGRAGTIEPGKMANLLVVDGELFTEHPKIRTVWVDGMPYENEEKKAGVDATGTPQP